MQNKQNSSEQKIFLSLPHEMRFLLIFLAFYTFLHMAYFMVPDQFLRDVVFHNGIVAMSENLINFAFPEEQVSSVSNKLVCYKASLEVVRGCDSSGALFLIISAIVAFSASLKRKLLGTFFGMMLICGLNQIRIISLYFIFAYRREWFLPVHTYFAPTFIVIISCMFFTWWAFGSQRSAPDGPPLAN